MHAHHCAVMSHSVSYVININFYGVARFAHCLALPVPPLPAELKSVKDSVDSLIKDKSEMQSYMHTLSEDLKDMKASLDE